MKRKGNSTKRVVLFLSMLVVLLWGGIAQADIVFTLGNNPQPDEQNILLNTGTSGFTVFGTTNQTNTSVKFTSTTDLLTEPSQGQAEIDATDGSLQNLSISLTNGETFKDMILNPECPPGSGGCGSATITVVDDNNLTFTYDLGNGQNFLTITAINGESIKSVTINATGFDDLNQPRISGIAGVSVPELSTFILLGSGLVGFVIARRRIKK